MASYATASYGAPNGTPGGQGDQAFVLIMTALVQVRPARGRARRVALRRARAPALGR